MVALKIKHVTCDEPQLTNSAVGPALYVECKRTPKPKMI